MLMTALLLAFTSIALWYVAPFQVVLESMVKTSLSKSSFSVAAEAEIAAAVASIAESIFFMSRILSLFRHAEVDELTLDQRELAGG